MAQPTDSGSAPALAAVRLVFLRWLVLIAASAPAALTAHSGLNQWAHRPWLTEGYGRISLESLVVLFSKGLEGFVNLFVAVVVLGMIADWITTAGTIRFMDPARQHGRYRLVTPVVFSEGTRALWPLGRALFTGWLLGALGVGVVVLVAEGVGTRLGFVSELRAFALMIGLTWLALVGAYTHFLQIVVVGDKRLVVRRAALVAARLCLRHVRRGVLLYAGLALGSTVVSAAFLATWRSAEPGGMVGPWLGGWLAILLVQATFWHQLIALGWRLWTANPDLREIPDEGFDLVGRLRRDIPKWRRRKLFDDGSSEGTV